MTVSKAQMQAVNRYKAKKYKRIALEYPLTEIDGLKQSAAAAGQALNAYIRQAIKERQERETQSKGKTHT